MGDKGFVLVGTAVSIPEDEEHSKRHVPIHEQHAHDDQGRRRFHGAFTGGFSAGYYNTVGSKEGWTPSTFVSSRKKAQNIGEAEGAVDPSLRNRVEYFMDEV
jgi:G patch domain-containing protein 1